MASKAEAQQMCGELLKLVPIGQALQSQHDAKMSEAYDEVYAELEVMNLPVWATTAEMPDEITPHFVNLMAYNKIDVYPVSQTLYQRILFKVGDGGEKAKEAIRALMNSAYCNIDEATDY